MLASSEFTNMNFKGMQKKVKATNVIVISKVRHYLKVFSLLIRMLYMVDLDKHLFIGL